MGSIVNPYESNFHLGKIPMTTTQLKVFTLNIRIVSNSDDQVSDHVRGVPDHVDQWFRVVSISMHSDHLWIIRDQVSDHVGRVPDRVDHW